MACRITIIGAGGATFVGGFLKDICSSEYLQDATVVLMDINRERLEETLSLAQRYQGEVGTKIKFIIETDRKKALEGADFVVHTALTISNQKLIEGFDVGFKHGYRFGGSLHIMHDEAFFVNFYQLRLMEEIAKDVLEVCPNAYYLLTANPVFAGVTYLKRKYPALKLVGMCPGTYCVNWMIDYWGLSREGLEYDFAGVNHFVWLTKLTHNGKDLMEELKQRVYEGKANRYPQNGECYKRYGMMPVGDTAEVGGGSWGWYYHSDDELEKEKCLVNDQEIWNRYFDSCKDKLELRKKIASDKELKVSPLIRGMAFDHTISFIESAYADLKRKIAVNIMNDGGYMKGLPLDIQTELFAIVDKNGVHPISNNGLNKPVMAALFRDRIAPLEMELAAFEQKSKVLLKELILMDPWTKTDKQAEEFLEEILNLPWNKEMKEYYK